MFAEENYLFCILELNFLLKNKLVRTNDIAKKLNYKPASITMMLQKLHLKKLVVYTKGKGVKLTNLGEKKALKFMREVMLWKLFFEKILLVVDKNKCTSLDIFFDQFIVEALDNFLGNPLYDLQGNAIPTFNGTLEHKFGLILSIAKMNVNLIVISLQKCTEEVSFYINKKELKPKVRIKIIGQCELDNSMDIRIIDSDKIVTISKNIADYILIKYE